MPAPAASRQQVLRLKAIGDLAVREAPLPWGWRRFAKASGFEGVTFHTLRHGAATLMLASGVQDAVAIKFMGHADTAILRRYQEVVDDLQRDAAARMDTLLGASGANRS